MTTLHQTLEPSPPIRHEVTIQACPSQFLKTIETLKHMGVLTTVFELSFKTISEMEVFTRILNRQQDEQKVANELKLTYFHNVRGKIKRTEMTKNQEFLAMKRIRFNSAYHVTLFVKYFDDRIKQLQNEYSYTLATGKDGFLHVYLNNDENISSMFINQIRDMKKRLNFLEIKDEKLCEKFVFSQALGDQLKKIGIFHEIWYRGRQSTMIFYSEKQPLAKMRTLVHAMSKYHMTILKMTDEKISFFINYLLFGLLKRSFFPQVRKLQSVEPNQVQFNLDKTGIVIHDKHEIFSPQIVEEILNNMKELVFMTVRAKNARKFYNLLKKHHFFDQALKFCYSKKNVCLCINIDKVKSFDNVRKMFGHIAEAIDQESQITFNWFHLQDDSLIQYRKSMMQRMILIFTMSGFHVENFDKFIQNKALKCNLRLKNVTRDMHEMSQYMGDVLTSIVKVWKVKDVMKDEGTLEEKLQERKVKTTEFAEDEDNQHGESQSNESENESQYDNQDENQADNQEEEPILEDQQKSQQKNKIQVQKEFQEQNKFTEQLRRQLKQKEPKFYESQTQNQWKDGKSWRVAQELLSNEAKIVAKVKRISIHQLIAQKVSSVRNKLLERQNNATLHFHAYESYSLTMYESPFYCPQTTDKPICRFEDLKVGDKFVVCCEMREQDFVFTYPLCSVEVMRKQLNE